MTQHRIDNLQGLSKTITAVVNRALETVTRETTDGSYPISYIDVADLIMEEDYIKYFDLITYELSSRPEVLDFVVEGHILDINCGYAWCKDYMPGIDEDITEADYGYRDISPEPSMARLAEIGKEAVDHLIMSHSIPMLTKDLLGISDEELEQLRCVTGWNKIYGPLGNKTLPPGVIPKTCYESLLLSSVQEQMKHAHTEPESSVAMPFLYCVNQACQLNYDILDALPEIRTDFEQIFHSSGATSASRSGALINGKGALILSYELNRLHLSHYSDASISVRQAMAAMMAGQLDEIFLCRGITATYGLNTGAGRDNEIMAILPAHAEPQLLREFDQAFASAVNDLSHARNVPWVQTQYDELRAHAATFMAEHPITNPWTIENLDRVTIHCCEALGRYIGAFHDDWQQAILTHNVEKLAQLSDRFDVTKTPATLDKVVREGVYHAEQSLSKRIKLYMDPDSTKGSLDSFTIPLGQLYLAMDRLGYGPDYPVSDFLVACSHTRAKEIKALTDAMPRLPLFQQMRLAQQRREQQGSDTPAIEADKDLDR